MDFFFCLLAGVAASQIDNPVQGSQGCSSRSAADETIQKISLCALTRVFHNSREHRGTEERLGCERGIRTLPIRRFPVVVLRFYHRGTLIRADTKQSFDSALAEEPGLLQQLPGSCRSRNVLLLVMSPVMQPELALLGKVAVAPTPRPCIPSGHWLKSNCIITGQTQLHPQPFGLPRLLEDALSIKQTITASIFTGILMGEGEGTSERHPPTQDIATGLSHQQQS